jgi:hypothetical protein
MTARGGEPGEPRLLATTRLDNPAFRNSRAAGDAYRSLPRIAMLVRVLLRGGSSGQRSAIQKQTTWQEVAIDCGRVARSAMRFARLPARRDF